MTVEKMKQFLIKFATFAIIFGGIVCLVRFALPALVPFLIALVVALLIKPLVNFLHRKAHISKKISSVLLVLLFYGTIGVLVVLAVLRLIDYGQTLIGYLPDFFKNNLVPLLTSAAEGLDDIIGRFIDHPDFSMTQHVKELVSSVGSALSSFSATILGAAGNVVISVPGAVINVFITIVSTVFLAMDFDGIRHFFARQLSDAHRATVRSILSHLSFVIRKYILSYALIMLITFFELWIGLAVLRIPSAPLIAALIAVFDLLPVVGSGTVLCPWAVVSLFAGETATGAGLLVLWAVISVIRYIIEPKIVGNQVGMHPLLTLFSMLLGNFIFGGIGILLLPVSLALIQNLNEAGVIHLYKNPEPKDPEDDTTLFDSLRQKLKNKRGQKKNRS